MGEMHEIVDMDAVNRVFLLLAWALPLTGALIGLAIGAKRQNVRQGLGVGVLAGLIGPLNLALWRIYNTITDHNGLDSIRNLFLNLALFITLGALLGIGLRRISGTDRENSTEKDASKDVTP